MKIMEYQKPEIIIIEDELVVSALKECTCAC